MHGYVGTIEQAAMLTDLVAEFPRLANTFYLRTSQPTFDYNCIAYAAGDDTQRWDPGFGYWPDGLPRNNKKLTLIKLFRGLGFGACKDGSIEDGFEKIVIYTKNGAGTHASKQLLDGYWSSKLGDLDDIKHTLDGLIGDQYGSPSVFMRRAVKT